MNNRSMLQTINSAFKALEESWLEKPDIFLRETGTVVSVEEGIARVKGLPNVVSDELVRFERGALGLVYNLDPDEVGIILLDDEQNVMAGDDVFRTDRILGVPVGEAFMGRVVNALGKPIDNLGPLRAGSYYPVERPSPPIMHRTSVVTPLQTGIVAIDALLPIGRGQRELILGDRQTGKTAIAIDTIINQKESGVICIYCGIGKQQAAINRVVGELRKYGALDHTIVMSASSSTPVGLQYIAPYAATSMAEYFMEQGRDVLVVYDDLTWHARAYRELALLLRRPPGREAFPGDIFHIHARLLERSTQLREEHGGGSITALPIIETQAQDMSAFIPTNLISITDGQIYLSPGLFHKDVLPAIDVGKSVSRVGGAAQLSAYRMVADELRLSYAQFEELEAFSRFSSRLDEDTSRQIERGRRIREVLKQQQFDTMPVVEQIAILVAVTNGMFDDISLSKIEEAIQEIRHNITESLEGLDTKIIEGDKLNDQDREVLENNVRKALRNSDIELVKETGADHAER